jgi:hypothetical protein
LELPDADDDTSTSLLTPHTSSLQAPHTSSDHGSSVFTDFLSTLHTTRNVRDDMSIGALNSLQVITWEKVKLATGADKNMEALLDLVESGFPTCRSEVPDDLQVFFQHKNHLSATDGVVLYKDRIVVPPSLRQNVLSLLHCAHQGVSRMIARAEASVYWPGITVDIHNIRKSCAACNRMAPSQPPAPPAKIYHPLYPFQMVCADFFMYKGKHYLALVDRYSNWLIVEKAKEGSKGLVDCLRRTFSTFGIPDEIATDGGLEFVADITQKFLKDWGIHHRISSVAFPHSNCRAEIGVKTAKRIISENTDHNGSLDLDAFRRAVLSYRNTPSPDSGISPAQCLFGRPIKDFIPIKRNRYLPHHTWSDTLDKREDALRNRHQRMVEKWSEHTKSLPPLKVGDLVRVQNQVGKAPRKWDKTGTIIEVKQHNQYIVKIDGSNRATLRNRKFLRKYEPMFPCTSRLRLTDKWKTIPGFNLQHLRSGNNHTKSVTPNVTRKNSENDGDDGPTPRKELRNEDDGDQIPIHDPPYPVNARPPRVKVPLALRRLASFNKPGLKEE